MPYSTIPITSGAAKFSTLDPDAPLFLEENNITVGANPENPATLYDYDSSTLHISNIETNNGELNLHNSDLIGVRRFVCQDYLGALVGSASNTLRKRISINVTGDQYSDMIRIPSNFVQGSKFRIIVTAPQGQNTIDAKFYDQQLYYVGNNQKVTVTGTADTYVYKYDPVSDTYTNLGDIITNGTVISGNKRYMDVSLKAGDYVCIKTESKTTTTTISRTTVYYVDGLGNHQTPFQDPVINVTAQSTVNSNFDVCCDMTVYSDPNAIWD